jgi:phosphoglycerate dehydrogenase-like enzyme
MSHPLTIFINQRFPDDAANELLARSLSEHRVFYSKSITTSNLAASGHDAAIDEADVAFGQPDPVAIMKAPRLRWVQLTSAGWDRYDRADLREAMAKRGAMVTNSSSVYEEPCAEHVVAMMLALARRLTGQTAILLSFGAIARRVVELLAPYRMNLIAVRRRPSGDEPIRVVAEDQLDALLPQADHVLNILPGGAATRGFVSARRVALMKSGSYFYNIGRGGTVDQAALEQALRAGRLGGAYLDVTDPEPLPADHGLWSAPNCFITPHTAGGHEDEFERLVRHFLGNLERFQKGEALKDRVVT